MGRSSRSSPHLAQEYRAVGGQGTDGGTIGVLMAPWTPGPGQPGDSTKEKHVDDLHVAHFSAAPSVCAAVFRRVTSSIDHASKPSHLLFTLRLFNVETHGGRFAPVRDRLRVPGSRGGELPSRTARARRFSAFIPGARAGDIFPLLTLDQIQSTAPVQMKTLAIEIGREAATIAMLAAIALVCARNAGQWAAAFVMAFGVWDITFYLFLKVLLEWPASMFTWDILFLVPVPWVGPVLAPVLVSVAMIAAGIWHLRRDTSETACESARCTGPA